MKHNHITESPVVGIQTQSSLSQGDSDYYDDVETPENQEGEYDDDEQQDADTPIDLSAPTDSDNPEDDPDRQGTIRTVADAHLVYKRRNENNQFTELWVYKENKLLKNNSKIYDAILAGTDIPKALKHSPDGSQTVNIWEIGPPTNTLVFVEIEGLQN